MRIFSYRIPILTVVILCIAMGVSHAQTPQNALAKKITLRSVLEHTYKHNPTIRAARAELRSTHEELPQALANWKPTISSTAEFSDTNNEGTPTAENSTTKQVGASLTQPIFRGFRTASQTAEARNTINAQLNSLYATEQKTLLDAATAYLDVVRDQALLELSIGNLKLRKTEHEATENRYEVGEITKTDVSQSKSRLAGAQADLITAKGNLRSSRAVFEQITGLAPDNLNYPSDNISEKLPKDLSIAINTALNKNPKVLSAKYKHAAAEEGTDTIFGELLPEINLDGSWNKQYEVNNSNDDLTTRKIGLSASIPLYTGGATRSRVRAAKETANQRYIEILETGKEVEQETITAWEALQTAKAEIESRIAQVEAARIASEGVSAEADLGERTILDTLDADQEYLDARSSLVTSKRNALVAKVSLMEKLGMLTPQELSFEESAINHQEHLDDVTSRIFSMGVEPLE